ncbi:hypothetical protein [Streptomyces massasporeus]|nr:hypothetical protein [Streptomyces massasporeus]GGV91659.1 hypothetical protein GCM10010228_82620 [Streptomyces massasporeus]
MSDRNDGGFVTTERTGPDEVTTVIVTSEGATAHRIPGGLTEDDLVD